MPWPDATGRGVRVAVIDSGIHAGHPHVGDVSGGVAIGPGDALSADTTDRLGHGTAVAAAIREKAPEAELYAVRVFERSLATTITHLVRAIAWSIEARMDVINLSLGTPREAHAPMLAAAVAQAAERGVLIVSAQENEGTRYYPGSLAGVVPVCLDWTCPRDAYRVAESGPGVSFLASGHPRPIPGVPPEHNLKGISFAVANMTGFVARLRERAPGLPVDAAISRLATGHRVCSANASPTRAASADVFA
jgi:subtilisin family serine protease